MGFSSKNYKKVLDEFDLKRNSCENFAAMKSAALRREIPELAEIDAKLASTGPELLSAALSGNYEKEFDRIRLENLSLQERRREILKANGYSEDEDDPKYECRICSDRGFVGGRMCDCLRRALIAETFRTSGIGELVKSQSFETFSKEYYADDPKAAESIEIILMLCRDFAENFTPGSGRNLLFTGKTGLGKTHLSTSIAKVVIEKGYDVVYDTAQNVFSDFEKYQFRRDETEGEDPTSKYFDCDLLIIDDLGTEMTNAFTVSCLYNIINTRINHRAPMIINTNLSQTELRSRYADRITSRLFGEFAPLHFLGKDIRSAKLM